MRIWTKLVAGLATALLLATPPPARALPDFAAQTGQPCTACHVGGYGPQLTPTGRAFKIAGYTPRGGEGWQSYVPLSAMVLTSFKNGPVTLTVTEVEPSGNQTVVVTNLTKDTAAPSGSFTVAGTTINSAVATTTAMKMPQSTASIRSLKTIRFISSIVAAGPRT